jgi:hypothetical protein
MEDKNPLSWPKFAEDVNATAKQCGLQRREFTGLNLAYNFSKARKDKQSMPSEWTKIEIDPVVECATKLNEPRSHSE